MKNLCKMIKFVEKKIDSLAECKNVWPLPDLILSTSQPANS